MLPPNYRDILAEGARALRWVEAGRRERAERHPEAAELWLGVRDAGGLADRLEWEDDWRWQAGFASLQLSPQDLGVLDEIAVECGVASPYRDEHGPGERVEHGARLRALRDFLARYKASEFAFEDAATYRPAGDSAPAS